MRLAVVLNGWAHCDNVPGTLAGSPAGRAWSHVRNVILITLVFSGSRLRWQRMGYAFGLLPVTQGIGVQFSLVRRFSAKLLFGKKRYVVSCSAH